jgi:hypothetical protein
MLWKQKSKCFGRNEASQSYDCISRGSENQNISKEMKPPEARGSISRGSQNQNVLEEMKPPKARGSISHESENQNVSEKNEVSQT